MHVIPNGWPIYVPFLSNNIEGWKQTSVYKNLKADLLVLDELHIDSFLAEDIGGAPEKIFMEAMHGTNLELQQRFAEARLEESKQKHKQVEFAPPGYVPPVFGGPHHVQLNEWTCDLIVASTGIQCGQTFTSRRGLNIHQSTALCHKKTKPVKGRMFVVSNICPWCNRAFGNINSARQHVFFCRFSTTNVQRIEEVHILIARGMCVTSLHVQFAKWRWEVFLDIASM